MPKNSPRCSLGILPKNSPGRGSGILPKDSRRISGIAPKSPGQVKIECAAGQARRSAPRRNQGEKKLHCLVKPNYQTSCSYTTYSTSLTFQLVHFYIRTVLCTTMPDAVQTVYLGSKMSGNRSNQLGEFALTPPESMNDWPVSLPRSFRLRQPLHAPFGPHSSIVHNPSSC